MVSSTKRQEHKLLDSPRIALIGCGAIAENYYMPALAKNQPVLQSLILVDENIDRARKLSATFNVKQCLTDYREALDKTDGAIIALPTHLHHPASMEFLLRGVPVLCEKPLADSADKASELVNVANQQGVALAVNYLQRLIPSFVKVKEILTQKILGEPISIKYFIGEEFNWPTISGFYFNSPLSSRGVLRDRGAHAIDHICWWLGGKPDIIRSQNDALGGSEAVASVQFKYGNCSGELRLSWLSSFPCIYQVTCERGVIEGEVYDYQNVYIQVGSKKKSKIKLAAKEKTKEDIADKIISNFIEVICRGSHPLVAGSEILNSMQFIDECYSKAIPFDMPWYGTYEVKHG